jgi:glutamate carboxypeptidase
LLDELAALVACESPSADLEATAACADLAAQIGARHLAAEPEVLEAGGRRHLRWRFGPTTRVALIGHVDTVWPKGTVRRWPFHVDGDRASGPGTFDMKAGVVLMLHALGALPDRGGVAVLLTTDEELGSPTSRELVEDTARGASAALILEGAVDGAVKIGRKGVSLYTLRVTGRAAHAGLEPELGVNAAVELAHQVLTTARLGRPADGTTVTPTVLRAGTTTNTVPDAASLSLDVRAATGDEQQRVDDAVRQLQPVVQGARLEVEGGPNRPPFPTECSAALFEAARDVAAGLGMPPLRGATVGGGSDGNFTAAIGVPTLDGLGAVGGHAHAEGEWVSVAGLAERAALLTGLVGRLLAA